jgi:hypothetical protein
MYKNVYNGMKERAQQHSFFGNGLNIVVLLSSQCILFLVTLLWIQIKHSQDNIPCVL